MKGFEILELLPLSRSYVCRLYVAQIRFIAAPMVQHAVVVNV